MLLAGCASSPSEAEIKTYKIVSVEYKTYVTKDLNLSESAKQRRLDLIETWRIRLGLPR